MAETGRSSTTKMAPPSRPLVYSELLNGFTDVGLSIHTTTKHGPRADIRRMYVVDEGYCILEIDQSQAEARIVAHLSGDVETLNLFNTTDIHSLTSGFIFGIPTDQIDRLPDGTKDPNQPQRFIGKTARHAGNYGQGKKTLMLDANAKAKKFGIPLKLSEKDAGNILTRFHAFTPKIRSVYFPTVERAITDNKRVLINPFGRPRLFLGRLDESLFREGYSTLPQGTVIDQTRTAMMNMKKRLPYIQFLLEWHDAAYVWAKVENLKEIAEVGKEEFERPIDFGRCTIPCGLLTIPCEMKIYKKDFLKAESYHV